MLQEVLKKATQSYHDDLEQLMFVNQIMDGSLTPARYKQLLVTNYLSHAYFEEQLFTALPLALKTELNLLERIKLPYLLKDVQELLIPIPELPATENIIPIEHDEASVLGAMYVMEGATLGGHVIVKRLLQNPHLQVLDLNYHYYQAYGDQLIPKWKQFVEVLNTRVPEADYDKAVKSASDMFENMKTLSKVAGLGQEMS